MKLAFPAVDFLQFYQAVQQQALAKSVSFYWGKEN